MSNRYFSIFLLVVFVALSLFAFFKAKPYPKNERVYQVVRKYSPYYLEKRLGGFTIRHKKDENFSLDPSAEEIFKRFEEFERDWAQDHLRLEGNHTLIIYNDGKILKKLELKEKDEVEFIKNYYGVRSD